jgi:hypothetical protein
MNKYLILAHFKAIKFEIPVEGSPEYCANVIKELKESNDYVVDEVLQLVDVEHDIMYQEVK